MDTTITIVIPTIRGYPVNHTIALNNEVEIPQIGFGAFRLDDGDEAYHAVRTALDCGYRLIDTAAVYGNEESVGRAIHDSGIDRDELFITTKVWVDAIRGRRTREAYEESLRKLGLDYADLYLIHWPVEHWKESWDELQSLYAEHRVRAIGVSNFEPHHLDELLADTDVVPAINQIESSPIFENNKTVTYTQSKNIAVEAYKPLGGREGIEKLITDRHLLDVSNKYGKSPTQVALRWQLQRDVIPLVKSSVDSRIIQNYHVFDFELSPEDMAVVNQAETGLRNAPDPDNITF